MRQRLVVTMARAAFAAALGLGVACSSSSSATVAEAQAGPAGTPAQRLVASYLTLQQKLAADDAKAAQAAFVQLRAAAAAKELTAHPELRQKLSAAAAAGAAAKDLDAARGAFVRVSDALIEWLQQEGNPLTKSVRVAHCPMAADGKGARWIQSEAKVANPYYGSEMLTCGSIEAEVKPGAKPKP